jgi:UDP-4-amino-4,6-dideoxy-N-acetyl-beta-L-altrosamine transaminase
MAFLPYGRQTIEDDDIAAVIEALRSDFLTTGPRVEAFEQAFADKVGARYAVSCSNATAGLHLAMLALKPQPGDVAIVPSITFLSTANAARFVGCDVVFADVDPLSGLMTPQTLADAIARAGGRRIAAVLPVHLRGDIVDLPAIAELAESVSATVIEDAAHAVGSSYAFGDDFGTAGDGAYSAMTVFSFHPVKTIATGEGGMVATNDPALAERLRVLRSHGMTRPEGGDPWIYEMAELGFNYRLPDINCALGLSQLAKLDRFVTRRRELAARYADLLGPHEDQINLATSPQWSNPALHLMTVLIDFDSLGIPRADVMGWLKAADIGTQVHYIPVHTQPYYRAVNPAVSLPGAEQWYAQALSLPLFPGMADQDVDRVVDALVEALQP